MDDIEQVTEALNSIDLAQAIKDTAQLDERLGELVSNGSFAFDSEIEQSEAFQAMVESLRVQLDDGSETRVEKRLAQIEASVDEVQNSTSVMQSTIENGLDSLETSYNSIKENLTSDNTDLDQRINSIEEAFTNGEDSLKYQLLFENIKQGLEADLSSDIDPVTLEMRLQSLESASSSGQEDRIIELETAIQALENVLNFRGVEFYDTEEFPMFVNILKKYLGVSNIDPNELD